MVKNFAFHWNVALGTSGCEAIVEGFYCLVAAHKKVVDAVLVQRAIVDWSIPEPISCPERVAKVAFLYTDRNKKRKLARHRLPMFLDERDRISRKHDVSLILDRLTTEKPRCPPVAQFDKIRLEP